MRLQPVLFPDALDGCCATDAAAAAMLRTLQWVAFGGFRCSVMSTTLLDLLGCQRLAPGRARGVLQQPVDPLGHVATAPATHRQQALAHRRRNLDRRRPSAANSTMRARQTTFCGVLRSRTSRSSRPRSVSLTEIRSIFLIGADLQVWTDL